jgi:hypothetical protein
MLKTQSNMIEIKPITDRPVGLSKDFNEIMEKSCPIWAWDKKQEAIRKNKKF